MSKANTVYAMSEDFVTGVYAEPSIKSTVLCTLPPNSELLLYPDESTDRWYKVCTTAGIEGYCFAFAVGRGL